MEQVQPSESADLGCGQPTKVPSQAHPGLQQGGPLLRGSALLVLVPLMVSSLPQTQVSLTHLLLASWPPASGLPWSPCLL